MREKTFAHTSEEICVDKLVNNLSTLVEKPIFFYLTLPYHKKRLVYDLLF